MKRGNVLKVMEEYWDLVGKTNPISFTVGEREYKNRNEYFDGGGREVNLFMKDVVERWGLEPKGKRMLEIGCGIGGQARAFSKMFGEVYATDISNVMITKATELNSDLNNVRFIKTNGQDLKDFPDNYFDFVYSYWVFMHIPDKGVISNYFQEIHHVLKIGGLFKIQLYYRPLHRKHWSFAFGFIPIPYFIGSRLPYWILKAHYYLCLGKKGHLPVGTRTIAQMRYLTKEEVRQMVQNSHLNILDLHKEELYEKLVNTWCLGKKE